MNNYNCAPGYTVDCGLVPDADPSQHDFCVKDEERVCRAAHGWLRERWEGRRRGRRARGGSRPLDGADDECVAHGTGGARAAAKGTGRLQKCLWVCPEILWNLREAS